MALEDTGHNTIIGECQIVILSFLLTADSERREKFTESGRMLAVHVLYGWKNRPSSSLKDALPPAPDFLRPVQVLSVLLYAVRCKNTFGLCNSQCHTMHLQDGHFVCVCNIPPDTLRLQQRFYSRVNPAALGLGSPTFTTNMYQYGQMKSSYDSISPLTTTFPIKL
jgi:hypothetical protein